VGGAAVEIPDEPPLVALTFDDGPHAVNTRLLLDGLAAREIPATFFLVGERLAGNEGLVREMAAAGHQIGVHTWDHVMLDGDVPPAEAYAQNARTRAALEHILGPGDYWLRPPYGIMDPEDWRDRDEGRIVDHVLSRVRDGDIILLHDMYEASVCAALTVCDALLERGFCFVTVEQLMALRGVEPEAGVRYDRLAP